MTATFNRPRTLSFAIDFAFFCQRNNIDPAIAADLCILAEKSFKAGERNCNEGTERSAAADHKAGAKVEALAEKLGFGVEWNGLYPTLTRAGQDIRIPSYTN